MRVPPEASVAEAGEDRSDVHAKEDEMKTILLATDGSPSAQKATEEAIELADELAATLRIVSAWQLPVYEYGYLPVPFGEELVDAVQSGAAKAAQHAVEAAEAAGVEVTSEIRRGIAADEICAAAEETAADMIVVGAHGWGAPKRLFFGSVSTNVLHNAPCPVLVVRGDSEPHREPDAVGAGIVGSPI
jgi:nucleotide-binding universal stress UspA family protein